MSRKGIGGRPSGFDERTSIVIYVDKYVKSDLRGKLKGRSFSNYIRELIENDLYGSE